MRLGTVRGAAALGLSARSIRTNFKLGWFPHVEDGARRDRTWSARASVYKRAFTGYGFSPELGVVHEVRRTNAQRYDYECLISPW